jgi:predicted alpha/beta-hydrolase family hydrolase
MLAAEEPDVTEGLLILSYPLHPPGIPTQLRTKHLPQIEVPSVFASGSKDPFGSLQEMETAMHTIPARTSFLIIEGAAHDLGYGRRPSKNMQDVPARIAQAFSKMLDISG